MHEYYERLKRTCVAELEPEVYDDWNEIWYEAISELVDRIFSSNLGKCIAYIAFKNVHVWITPSLTLTRELRQLTIPVINLRHLSLSLLAVAILIDPDCQEYEQAEGLNTWITNDCAYNLISMVIKHSSRGERETMTSSLTSSRSESSASTTPFLKTPPMLDIVRKNVKKKVKCKVISILDFVVCIFRCEKKNTGSIWLSCSLVVFKWKAIRRDFLSYELILFKIVISTLGVQKY